MYYFQMSYIIINLILYIKYNNITYLTTLRLPLSKYIFSLYFLYFMNYDIVYTLRVCMI